MFAKWQHLQRAGDLVGLLHAGAHGADAGEDHDIAGDDRAGAERGDGGGFAGEDAGGAGLAIDAVGIDDRGIERGGFDDGAFGREIADGENHGAGEAAFAGHFGGHDDVVGVHAVTIEEDFAETRSPFALLPGVEILAEREAGRGERGAVEQAERAEVEHDLGHAAGEEGADGGVKARAVWEDIDEARGALVHGDPVGDRRAREPGGMGDGGDVEEEIRGAAECCVDGHRIADGGGREDVARGDAARLQCGERAGGAGGDFTPDGLAAGRERGVGKREAESFGDDLRGGGGAEKLAAAAGRGARAAAEVGGLFEGDEAAGESRADGLDRAGVLAIGGRERDAAGDEDAREIVHGGEGHHHGGESLVAGGDAEDAGAARERADEAAEDEGGVVAIRQRVEHAGGALRAAVARVGAGGGEWDGAERFQLARGGLDEQADFPMAGVIAQRDGGAIRRAEAALRGEDEELLSI